MQKAIENFTIKNLHIDKSKENVVFLLNNSRVLLNEYNNFDGYKKIVADALSEKYNVFYICNNNRTKDIPNVIYFSEPELDKTLKDVLKRKVDVVEGFDYRKANCDAIFNYLDTHMANLPDFKYVIFTAHCLPLSKYSIAGERKFLWNEFYDYVGEDKNVIDFIEKINKEINENIHKHLNPLAFAQKGIIYQYGIIRSLIKYNPDIYVSNMAIDPSGYDYIYQQASKRFTNYYFADDNRGTRRYTAFPLGEVQCLVYDADFDNDDLFENTDTKDKNFLFFGTILYEKGERAKMYDLFLKDLHIPNSSYYIPPKKNGIVFKNVSEKIHNDYLKKMNKHLKLLHEQIIKHPSYKGYLLPQEIVTELKKYKYTLLLRCVSYYDSLNFRIFMCLENDVLPFIDEKYDTKYLQIPKYFQDRLTVSNSEDIKKLYDYFEANPQERIELLEKLKKHFNYKKWKNRKYAYQKVLEYFP